MSTTGTMNTGSTMSVATGMTASTYLLYSALFHPKSIDTRDLVRHSDIIRILYL